MTDDIESRLSQLEQKVQALEALVAPPPQRLPNSDTSLSDEAVRQVTEQLGAVEIEREGVEQSGVEARVDAAAERRAKASDMALFFVAKPLDRNFRPSTFGYTADDFSRDYPDVNPTAVLESFFNHHLAKGDVSKNWLEKFWSYAARAQQIEREKRMNNPTETDSMGLPLDRKARREMLGQ